MPQRTPEFEDMESHEWPDELRSLQHAAQNAYYVLAELDLTLSHIGATAEMETRGPIIDLCGRAYNLLRDLRLEGMIRAEAWQEKMEGREPHNNH